MMYICKDAFDQKQLHQQSYKVLVFSQLLIVVFTRTFRDKLESQSDIPGIK